MRTLILSAALSLVALLGQAPPKADAQAPRSYGDWSYYYTPGYSNGRAYVYSGGYAAGSPYGLSYGTPSYGYYQPAATAYYSQPAYPPYVGYGYGASPAWNGYRGDYAPRNYYRGGPYTWQSWGGAYRR
jgi:hypothetical protein